MSEGHATCQKRFISYLELNSSFNLNPQRPPVDLMAFSGNQVVKFNFLTFFKYAKILKELLIISCKIFFIFEIIVMFTIKASIPPN